MCGWSPLSQALIKPQATIDWGDGTVTSFTDEPGMEETSANPCYHEYTDNKVYNTYVITITGIVNWNYYDLTDKYYNFRYDLSSIEIPEGERSPIYHVSQYGFAYYRCKSYPPNLLENCKKTVLFNHLFYDTKNVGTIPENFFDKCINASTFESCFARSSVNFLNDEIPNLFKNCKKVINFQNTFNWINYRKISEGIFDNCPLANNFCGTFSGNSLSYTVPENIFAKFPDGIDLSLTFYNSNKLIGKAPELWKTHPNSPHERCFYQCATADNWDEIPEDWKK